MPTRQFNPPTAGFFFPGQRIGRMKQERFPILTIFCLIFLGWHLASSVVYFWVTHLLPSHVVSLSLARIFVAAGLPYTSIIPVPIDGRVHAAIDWIRAANTKPGAAILRASDWLLFYLPVFSIFLAALSIWTARRWRKKRAPKLLRGVQVIRR